MFYSEYTNTINDDAEQTAYERIYGFLTGSQDDLVTRVLAYYRETHPSLYVDACDSVFCAANDC